MTEKQKLAEALEAVFPFEIVQGDTIARLQPQSTVSLNTSTSWGVTQEGRSAHKLRGQLELVEQAARAHLETLNAPKFFGQILDAEIEKRENLGVQNKTGWFAVELKLMKDLQKLLFHGGNQEYAATRALTPCEGEGEMRFSLAIETMPPQDMDYSTSDERAAWAGRFWEEIFLALKSASTPPPDTRPDLEADQMLRVCYDQMLATLKAHTTVYPETWNEAIQKQIERWERAFTDAGKTTGRLSPLGKDDLARVGDALKKAQAFGQGEISYTAYSEIDHALRIIENAGV